MIQSIPLNKLTLSPRNVRRCSDEQADLQLKADIEARGLLQNLVVVPAKKPRGSFTVEAGGRRLRAPKALVEDGVLEFYELVRPPLKSGSTRIRPGAKSLEGGESLRMGQRNRSFMSLIRRY